MFLRRNLIHPLMEAFDGADLNQSCEARRVSVTATQSLTLLNGRFAHENSLDLTRAIQQISADDERRIDALFWRAFARAPSSTETEACRSFLAERRHAATHAETAANDGTTAKSADAPAATKSETVPDRERAAWRDLVLAMINANEFVYLD